MTRQSRLILLTASKMADRHLVHNDRHKVPRVMETGAAKRRRIKEEADKLSKLLSQTRRMTDFVKVCEASAVLPVALDQESGDTGMITGDGNADMPTSLSNAVAAAVCEATAVHPVAHEQEVNDTRMVTGDVNDDIILFRRSCPILFLLLLLTIKLSLVWQAVLVFNRRFIDIDN